MQKLSKSWLVVSASAANIALAYGVSFSFSVFLVPLLSEFGWSRAYSAGAFSLWAVVVGFGSWIGGTLVDRFGARTILLAGCFFLSLAMFLSSLTAQIWHLYLFFGGLAAVGTSCLGWVPNSVIIANWFPQNRGRMVGLAFSGMGIGMLIIGPFATFLIESFGWRAAYGILGLVVLAVLGPLNLMIRDHPGTGEPQHIDRRKDAPAPGPPAAVHREERTLRGSLKTFSLWALFFSFLLTPLGIFPVMVHMVAYLVELRYSQALAALIFGTIGLLSTAGRIFFGALSDRTSRENAVIWSFLCSIAGVVVLIFLPLLGNTVWLWLYALFFGIAFGARGPIIASMMADMYGGRHYGSIYGFVNIANGVGGALGPWFGGYIHDLTGNYTAAFVICIPVLAAACILLVLAARSQ
jgi:MFS family permease